MIFRLFFTDLMMFVPNKTGTEMTVLLVDGKNQVPSQVTGNLIGGHDPFLLCDARNVVEPRIRGRQGDQFATTFHLDSQHVTIKIPGGDPTPLDLAGPSKRLPGNGLLPNNNGRDDFRWIASLTEISAPDFDQINGDCFLAQPPPGLVSARVKLTQGTLKTYRHTQLNDDIHSLDFAFTNQALNLKAPLGFARAVSDIMVLEMTLDDDGRVEIYRSRFGGAPQSTVVLKGVAGEETLDAVIANSPDRLNETLLEEEPPANFEEMASRVFSMEALLKTKTECSRDNPPPALDVELLSKVVVGSAKAPRAFGRVQVEKRTQGLAIQNAPFLIQELQFGGSIKSCENCPSCVSPPHPDA